MPSSSYNTALPPPKHHSQSLNPPKYLLPSSQDHPPSYSLLNGSFPETVFSHPSCPTDGRIGLNSKAGSFPNAKPVGTDWLQYSSVGSISQVAPCSAQRRQQDKQSSLDTAARNCLLGNSFQTLLEELTASVQQSKLSQFCSRKNYLTI